MNGSKGGQSEWTKASMQVQACIGRTNDDARLLSRQFSEKYSEDARREARKRGKDGGRTGKREGRGEQETGGEEVEQK